MRSGGAPRTGVHVAGPGGCPIGLRVQPRHEKFFPFAGKARTSSSAPPFQPGHDLGDSGGVAWGHSLGCRPIWATAAVKLGGRPFGELRPALAWRDDLREPAAAPDRGSPGWCRAAWSARVHLSVMRRRPDRASTVRDDAGLVNTRVPCSMTTGRRFAAANTVFTWTKSTVRMLLACAARNCFLVGHRRQIGHGTRVRAPAVHRRVCHLRHRRHHHPPHPALAGKRQTPVSKTPVIAPDQATGKDHSHDMAAR